jgi:hypothetical protein
VFRHKQIYAIIMEVLEAAKFRIRITKCSHSMFWYNDRVGEEFSVIGMSGARDYIVDDKKGGILIIDAEIIK